MSAAKKLYNTDMKDQDGLYVSESRSIATQISFCLFLLFALLSCGVTPVLPTNTNLIIAELQIAAAGLACILGYKAAYAALTYVLCVELRIDVAGGRYLVTGPWRAKTDGPLSDFVQLRGDWPAGRSADDGGV
jgi:hypothetical protein